MQCNANEMMKGKYADAWIHVTFRASFPPSWLTDRAQGDTHRTGRKPDFRVLLLKQLHCGIMISLFLRVMSRGIFNVLVESPLNLLRPIVDVANPEVEVVKPLSEVTIPSG